MDWIQGTENLSPQLDSQGVCPAVDLLQPDEQIAFVEELLERYQVSPTTCGRLRALFDGIRRRSADPRLYLALVGEFSSGKSTFINALLRDRLLPAKCLPTTAAETRIVAGAFGVRVSPRSNAAESVELMDSAEACFPPVAWLPEAEGLGVRQLIPLVTAEGSLAHKVARVVISHPSSFLQNRVVLVDTPGVNSFERDHTEITQRILNEKADILGVLISATQPVSETLIDFLDQVAKGFLPHCVFFLTKIDVIDPDEREQVVSAATKRLVDGAGLIEPVVVACAPERVLRDGEGSSWGHDFANLERSLEAHLRRHRVLCIGEKLARLLDETLSLIEDELLGQLPALEQTEGTLRRESLQDLETFLALVQDDSIPRQRGYALRYHAGVSSCGQVIADQTLHEIQERFMSAAGPAPSESLLHAIDETFRGLQQRLHRVIGPLEREYLGRMREEAEIFDHHFALEYRKLCRLTTTSPPPRTGSGWVGSSLGRVSIATPNVPVERFGQSNLAPQKQQMWKAVWPELRASILAVMKEVEANVASQIGRAEERFACNLMACDWEYRATVDRLIELNSEDLQRVRDLQRTAIVDADRIATRRMVISQTIAAL